MDEQCFLINLTQLNFKYGLFYFISVLSENFASPWRTLQTSLPLPTTAYSTYPVSIPSSLSVMSSTDASMFSTVYGQMLAAHPLYNRELLLRSQLLKGFSGAHSLQQKRPIRYHPYLTNPNEKHRDDS